MIRFECDYLEGACPEIMQKLIDTNLEQHPGYGNDKYCPFAIEKIKKRCNCPNAYVQFLVGGTQTNMTVIHSLLKPYQGVLSAQTGHINVLEAGAIETTGHKVLVIETENGKLTASAVLEAYQKYQESPSKIHLIPPGMVYISYPTEGGLIYTKQELQSLYQVCQMCHLPLYIDGARLGYGLMSNQCDMDISDIAQNCDAFYIGGTKVGALFGEAVVITNEKYKEEFKYYVKQKGALLAKGRLLGIQFDTLFENDLYFKLSKHAINMAMKLKNALLDQGYSFLYDSNTNQQFPILPNKVLEQLSKKYVLNIWEKLNQNDTAIRICTSWATKEEDIDSFISDLKI